MRRLFLFLLLFSAMAISGMCWSDQKVTRLQCDGKYSNVAANILNVEIRGGFVEIRNDSVKVDGIVSFDARYTIAHESEASVCFENPADKLFGGCLNRFSGHLFLHQMSAIPRSGESGAFLQLYSGECRPAKPLF